MKRWFVTALVCLPFASGALAEEKHRQLGAHEHGHGSFNIAIEGKRVSMELKAPGADIVGFEHKASSKKDKAAISEAKKKLTGPDNVIGLTAAAGCKLEKVSVEHHIEGGDHDQHSHTKKKAKAGHSHGKHEKDKAEGETHAEFHVEYHMICSAPEKLLEITFPYFKNFTGAKELEVAVIGPKSQKKFEVERDTAKISLAGVI